MLVASFARPGALLTVTQQGVVDGPASEPIGQKYWFLILARGQRGGPETKAGRSHRTSACGVASPPAGRKTKTKRIGQTGPREGQNNYRKLSLGNSNLIIDQT